MFPKLFHEINDPSIPGIKVFPRQNIAKNNPVNMIDIKTVGEIFGADIAFIKGESKKPNPPIVFGENLIELPPELVLNKKTIQLNMDVVLIND